MIKTVFGFLKQTLVAAGCKRVYLDEREIEQQNPLPYAVILPDEGALTRENVKIAQQDDPVRCLRTYRDRIFRRDLTVVVTLVHKDVESLGTLSDAFLAGMQASILDPAGNVITLECHEEKWIRDGSLLKGKAAVEIPVIFHGGVYAERDVPLVGVLSFEGEISSM
ncbi:MAG: hypothetical protein IMW99_03675 [Firmicutes bacterium]|nr:hypothetical protein [Bacillota bacterium]